MPNRVSSQQQQHHHHWRCGRSPSATTTSKGEQRRLFPIILVLFSFLVLSLLFFCFARTSTSFSLSSSFNKEDRPFQRTNFFLLFASAAAADAPSSSSSSSSPLWSYRLHGGSTPYEGRLEIMPPTAIEWGTVCGNAERYALALQSGASQGQARQAFFSDAASDVACASVFFYPVESEQPHASPTTIIHDDDNDETGTTKNPTTTTASSWMVLGEHVGEWLRSAAAAEEGVNEPSSSITPHAPHRRRHHHHLAAVKAWFDQLNATFHNNNNNNNNNAEGKQARRPFEISVTELAQRGVTMVGHARPPPSYVVSTPSSSSTSVSANNNRKEDDDDGDASAIFLRSLERLPPHLREFLLKQQQQQRNSPPPELATAGQQQQQQQKQETHNNSNDDDDRRRQKTVFFSMIGTEVLDEAVRTRQLTPQDRTQLIAFLARAREDDEQITPILMHHVDCPPSSSSTLSSSSSPAARVRLLAEQCYYELNAAALLGGDDGVHNHHNGKEGEEKKGTQSYDGTKLKKKATTQKKVHGCTHAQGDVYLDCRFMLKTDQSSSDSRINQKNNGKQTIPAASGVDLVDPLLLPHREEKSSSLRAVEETPPQQEEEGVLHVLDLDDVLHVASVQVQNNNNNNNNNNHNQNNNHLVAQEHRGKRNARHHHQRASSDVRRRPSHDDDVHRIANEKDDRAALYREQQQQQQQTTPTRSDDQPPQQRQQQETAVDLVGERTVPLPPPLLQQQQDRAHRRRPRGDMPPSSFHRHPQHHHHHDNTDPLLLLSGSSLLTSSSSSAASSSSSSSSSEAAGLGFVDSVFDAATPSDTIPTSILVVVLNTTYPNTKDDKNVTTYGVTTLQNKLAKDLGVIARRVVVKRIAENTVILPSCQLETRTEEVYKKLTTINITSTITFAYLNISFLASGSSSGSSGAGSQTAGVTESPESSQATPSMLMQELLQPNSVALEAKYGFLEVRVDTAKEVGVVNGNDGSPWRFVIDPVELVARPSYDFEEGGITNNLTKGSSVASGVLKALLGRENLLAGAVCNLNPLRIMYPTSQSFQRMPTFKLFFFANTADPTLRYGNNSVVRGTASVVCGSLGYGRSGAAWIVPHFADQAGMVSLSDFACTGSFGCVGTSSPYFQKQNGCGDTDGMGILCAPGAVPAGSAPLLQTAPSSLNAGKPYGQSSDAMSFVFSVKRTQTVQNLADCPAVLAYNLTRYVHTGLQALYGIPPYRLALYNSSYVNFEITVNFVIMEPSALRETNTYSAGFSAADIAMVLGEINAAGYQMVIEVGAQLVDLGAVGRQATVDPNRNSGVQAAIGIHEFVPISTRNVFPRPGEVEQETLLQLYLDRDSSRTLNVGRELYFLFGWAPGSMFSVLWDGVVNGSVPSAFGPLRQPPTDPPEPTEEPTTTTPAPNTTTTTRAPTAPPLTRRPYVVRRGKRMTITPSLSNTPLPAVVSTTAAPNNNDGGAQYRMVLPSFAYPSMAQRLVEYLSGPTDGNGLQPEDYTDLRNGMPLPSFLLCEANMCARRGLGCLSPRASFTEYASSRVGAATNGSATTFGASTVYVTPPPPPPDLVPVLASTLTILALLIVGAILAALIIRRVFYTRTTKRWDDDYVMMNTKVLTVPLFDPMNAGAFEEEGGRGFDGAKRRHMTHHNSNNEEEEDEDDLELLGISPRGAGASSSAAPPRDVFGFEDTLMSPRKLRERRRQMGHDDDDDNDNDHRRVPANEDDDEDDSNDRGGSRGRQQGGGGSPTAASRRHHQEKGSNRSLSHSNKKKKNQKPSGRPPQRSGGGGGGDGSGIDAFDLGALF